MSHSSEYTAWDNMIGRCYRKSQPWYSHYGGKGIKVHPDWKKSFTAFISYIGSKPTKHHTLDRIDSSKDYQPGNVRWATPLQQTINQALRKDNTSGYKGVGWSKAANKWYSSICIDGKNIHLGLYIDKKEAAYVRDQVALQLWGADAKFNII